MTTTPRKTACIAVVLFLAAIGALARFAASAPPGTSGQDPADPKFAGHFRGQVLNPDDKPLAGARVYLVREDHASHDASTGAASVRTKTDADGRFEFDAPDMTFIDLDGLRSRRPGLLIARAPGYAPGWTQTWGQTLPAYNAESFPVKGADLTLHLAADDVPIHGRFLDSDGRPVSGARVQLADLRVPKHRDLDAYLEQEVKSNIFVCPTEVERWLNRPNLVPSLTTETRTDLDGRFTLPGLGRDRLAELMVTAPGVVATYLTVMTRDVPDLFIRQASPSADDPTRNVIFGANFTLQVRRGLTVTGVVRDRDTHEPIPGMWIGWRLDPLDGLSSGKFSVATDAEGRFTITGLDPGNVDGDERLRQVMAIAGPGLPYVTAWTTIKRDSEIVIECRRGIPFRLKLVDEQGQPVEAEVTSCALSPNPHVASSWPISDIGLPINRAAKKADGTYEGFVVPGPGAVLVKTPDRLDYGTAHVDPKAFFAPHRTDWTAQERISKYGSPDTLSTLGGELNQHDYSAIVLVRPRADSAPLELVATVVRDIPRLVSLVDSDGQPVVVVETLGITFNPWDAEPALRAATFPLRMLHPERTQRITFFHEERKLIGLLFASGDGDTPYTVPMRPWAAVTGRLVDPAGNPLPTDTPPLLDLGEEGAGTVINPDPNIGVARGQSIDVDGLFRIDRLIPGQRYSAKVYRGVGMFAGMAFENLVVGPGEVRNLGDIRTQPPVDVRGK